MQLENYPDVLTVKDIEEILHISTTKAYTLAKSNAFRTVRVGTLIKIPKQSFLHWLNSSNN